jgi:hypothetical protein
MVAMADWPLRAIYGFVRSCTLLNPALLKTQDLAGDFCVGKWLAQNVTPVTVATAFSPKIVSGNKADQIFRIRLIGQSVVINLK